MRAKSFALQGHILHSMDEKTIEVHENSVLVCEEGKVAGIFPALPQQYSGLPLHGCGGRLVVPGFVDLHLHAPQYAFRGLGMDRELLAWLEERTFPEEEKYAGLAYAEKAYRIFTDALAASATTRACVFATVHTPATLLLMDMLEETGLVTMVGKVNQDRNSTPGLQEESAEASLAATRQWLRGCGGYARTRPMLTPRFLPACTDELAAGLAELQRQHGLPVQSHLSENLSEVALVGQLCPEADGYADAYRRRGLLGPDVIMAHCVHLTAEEMAQLAAEGTFAAHCPNSNTNLASGIAPVRALLQHGVRVGLGTDMAGGFSLCMLRAMADAVQASKLRWRLVDESLAPLSVAEAFYLATRGGGAFFGQVGAFLPGYEFDAVVLGDEELPTPLALTPAERLERLVYLGGSGCVAEKYVAGRRVK